MPKSTLDREAWLLQALETLLVEGVAGVRIERLARDLGVTKGSFYWHFRDRDDLLRAILAFWVDAYNKVVTEAPEFLDAEPASALLGAMRLVRAEGLDRYELAIRAWAARDAAVDRVVKKVYARRKQFIRGCFERAGFDSDEAEIRSRLVLCYLSWEPNMYAGESKRRRLQHLEQVVSLLLPRDDEPPIPS